MACTASGAKSRVLNKVLKVIDRPKTLADPIAILKKEIDQIKSQIAIIKDAAIEELAHGGEDDD